MHIKLALSSVLCAFDCFLVPRYQIDVESVEAQLAKANERFLNGKLTEALPILEAITEEFVDRLSHLGERNVQGHKEVQSRIASQWVDAFLSEPLPPPLNGTGEGKEEGLRI